MPHPDAEIPISTERIVRHHTGKVRYMLGDAGTITHNNRHFIIGKVGSEFHPFPGRERDPGHWIIDTEWEFWADLYQPVHADMTPAQIEGARYAEDTGTHWKFYACSPSEHHDFADEVEAFAVSMFQPDINEAIIKRMGATNRRARDDADDKLEALEALAKAVCLRVHATVMGQTLGYYHENPHADHKRTLTRTAITETLDVWNKGDADAKAMRTQVLADASKLVAKLSKVNTIKTPEQKRAEEAAAKKKATASLPAENSD